MKTHLFGATERRFCALGIRFCTLASTQKAFSTVGTFEVYFRWMIRHARADKVEETSAGTHPQEKVGISLSIKM